MKRTLSFFALGPRLLRVGADPWRIALPALVGLCSAVVLMAAGAAPGPARVPQQAAAQPAPITEHAARYAQALEHLRSKRFAEAYGRLAQLADEGHLAAASLALTMVHCGEQAFGAPFSATAGQLKRWNELSDRDLFEQLPEITGHDRGE